MIEGIKKNNSALDILRALIKHMNIDFKIRDPLGGPLAEYCKHDPILAKNFSPSEISTYVAEINLLSPTQRYVFRNYLIEELPLESTDENVGVTFSILSMLIQTQGKLAKLIKKIATSSPELCPLDNMPNIELMEVAKKLKQWQISSANTSLTQLTSDSVAKSFTPQRTLTSTYVVDLAGNENSSVNELKPKPKLVT